MMRPLAAEVDEHHVTRVPLAGAATTALCFILVTASGRLVDRQGDLQRTTAMSSFQVCQVALGGSNVEVAKPSTHMLNRGRGTRAVGTAFQKRHCRAMAKGVRRDGPHLTGGCIPVLNPLCFHAVHDSPDLPSSEPPECR